MTSTFSLGFLDAIWQITPQQCCGRVTEPATARAEFEGRDFAESLCWVRGLVKALQLKTVCLLPYSSWYGSGMPLLIHLSCSLLAYTTVPGFKASYKPAFLVRLFWIQVCSAPNVWLSQPWLELSFQACNF